jgi:hypothetical protein
LAGTVRDRGARRTGARPGHCHGRTWHDGARFIEYGTRHRTLLDLRMGIHGASDEQQHQNNQ